MIKIFDVEFTREEFIKSLIYGFIGLGICCVFLYYLMGFIGSIYFTG